jgi:shikimate dehydrogenase
MSDKYGLVGFPLTHSRSPEIHSLLFAISKKSGEYDLYQTENLDNIRELIGGLCGFNVTIPYKTEIISHIDEIRGEAELFMSVNTVSRKAGRLIGYNTDCAGFLSDLRRLSIPFSGRICLLGAGGAARTVAFSAAQNGCDLTIAVRNREKGELLKHEIERKIGISPIKVTDLNEIGETSEGFDLLINATPVGMFPNEGACPCPDRLIENCAYVYDLIYNPIETTLVKKARKAGKIAATGLGMLVFQAAAAQTIWTGVNFTESDISGILDKIS